MLSSGDDVLESLEITNWHKFDVLGTIGTIRFSLSGLYLLPKEPKWGNHAFTSISKKNDHRGKAAWMQRLTNQSHMTWWDN